MWNNIEIQSAIISAIFGLISGAIASLIAPWVHWGIEKKRAKLELKKDTIKFLKESLDHALSLSGDSQIKFTKHRFYTEIRPYLKEEIRKQFEDGFTVTVLPMSNISYIKSIMTDEIARIEKEWGLI